MLEINVNGMVSLETEMWRSRIAKQFEGAGYSDKTTVNVVNTFVFGRKGISQTLFRFHVFITNGSFEDCEDARQRFKILNVEAEVYPI